MAEPALALTPADDLITAFRRDGYVVIRGLFGENWRKRVLADIVRTFRLKADQLGLDAPDSVDQKGLSELMAAVFKHDIPTYIAAAKLTQHLVSLHQMSLGPEMMGVVEALGFGLPAVSTRPVIHYVADRLRIPGGYHKTLPHQDWRSVQGSLDGITAWTPIFDVGLGDYPLEIAPDSHLRGLLDCEHGVNGFVVDPGLWDDGEFKPLPMQAGDAIVFSGFLLHRTGERGGEDVRVALSFRFNNVAEPRFVERNFPNTYIYRAEPKILTPDFPNREELATIFPRAKG
jgi:ectoine hydroxylase-related dioxygenase (phytanoyl-CoA dioxygenase family)